MQLLLLIAGLLLLIAGAEILIRGATRIASTLGISPLVIGLTVVAFGTSAPELAVSFNAAAAEQVSVVLGNIIGSNIFNVLFILGVSALITPLVVSQQLIRIDVPLMIGVSLLTWIFSFDGTLSPSEGAVLFGGLLMYVGFLIYQSKKEPEAVKIEYAREYSDSLSGGLQWAKNIGYVIGGLGLLVVGSNWLVENAVKIAVGLGVSELVVGLTIVAAGTSLPEVVTSIVASLRGERDIAVGNVVGSNIFNLLGILGLVTIINPGGFEISEAVIRFDLPVMILVAFACLPIFLTGGQIGRWEGGLLLAYYVAYTTYLVLTASQHQALPYFNTIITYVTIPLTLLILLIGTVRSFRRSN